MSIPNLPAPDSNRDDASEEPSRSRGHDRTDRDEHSRASSDPPIPTELDCLRALHRLSQLLLLGMVTPAQANSIRANVRETLTHHRHQRSDPRGAEIPQAELRRMLRDNPQVVNAFAAFLTPEQIDELVRNPGVAEDE